MRVSGSEIGVRGNQNSSTIEQRASLLVATKSHNRAEVYTQVEMGKQMGLEILTYNLSWTRKSSGWVESTAEEWLLMVCRLNWDKKRLRYADDGLQGLGKCAKQGVSTSEVVMENWKEERSRSARKKI